VEHDHVGERFHVRRIQVEGFAESRGRLNSAVRRNMDDAQERESIRYGTRFEQPFASDSCLLEPARVSK
jgi:hypothetical protein